MKRKKFILLLLGSITAVILIPLSLFKKKYDHERDRKIYGDSWVDQMIKSNEWNKMDMMMGPGSDGSFIWVKNVNGKPVIMQNWT